MELQGEALRAVKLVLMAVLVLFPDLLFQLCQFKTVWGKRRAGLGPGTALLSLWLSAGQSRLVLPASPGANECPGSVPEAGKGTPARAAGERPLPVAIPVKPNPEYRVMSWDTVLVHQSQT